MASRLGTLLFVLAATCLAVAEAKTLLKGKLFGKYESKLVAKHKETISMFKAKYTSAKTKSSFKSLGIRKEDDSTPVLPVCEFIPDLISTNPPIGLTLCQSSICACSTNQHCDTFANPLLDGLGVCVCGNSLCDDSTGLNCAKSTSGASFTCTTSPVSADDPYRRSRLMRRALS